MPISFGCALPAFLPGWSQQTAVKRRMVLLTRAPEPLSGDNGSGRGEEQGSSFVCKVATPNHCLCARTDNDVYFRLLCQVVHTP